MVVLAEQKNTTHHKAIEAMPLPARVYIPLSQHLGKICIPEVKVGDNVLTGQRIAGAEVKVFAPIHASVSGRVAAIDEWAHPVLGRCKAIVIESDGKDTKIFEGKSLTPKAASALTPADIRKAVFDAGVVGLGGASFPAHIKLTPPKPVDTLIINGAECEPFLTDDYRVMIEKTAEICAGIELVARCLGVAKVYLAIEDNKPDAIKAFERLRKNPQQFILKELKSDYPQGGEKQLIRNVLGKEVPRGKLPFDVGVVVHNVATVYAMYEAIVLRKPLYERVVTVSGSLLASPKNLLVRIGTPIQELIDFCGPVQGAPAKIIIGGPMMGIAQYTTQVPVIKSSTAVLVLGKKEAEAQEEEYCIRCGACVRACPAGLMPCLINLASEKELWKETKAYAAMDCIECGLCNYVCPAKRKLTQSIRRAKFEVAK